MSNLSKKYPWLNFSIDLSKLPVNTWIQLGKCLSKIEHISRVPLKPGISEEMHTVYLVKGVRATTAIEGNTLTEEEVRLRLEKKLKLPPSKEYLGQEVDNIIELCNEIKNNKIPNESDHSVNRGDILKYNRKILEGVPLAEYVTPGKLRNYSVVVGGYRPPAHSDVSVLINKYCDWLNSGAFTIGKEQTILNSIVKAVLAHLYFAWIHPFGDGNGRTARMIEFYILLSSGIPTPAVHLLSNHYNATRTEYYRQLDEARKKRDANNFISYAIQGFLDGLSEQLEYIFRQVLATSWESYVYERFRESKHHEVTVKRRRNLLLELSKKTEPVPLSELISMSKSTVEDYHNKTSKTLSRDIKELEKLDLVKKTADGYKAKKEKISAFIPLTIK